MRHGLHTKKFILGRMLTRGAPINQNFYMAFRKLGRIYLDYGVTLYDTRWLVWRMGYFEASLAVDPKFTTENIHDRLLNTTTIVKWIWGWHSLHLSRAMSSRHHPSWLETNKLQCPNQLKRFLFNQVLSLLCSHNWQYPFQTWNLSCHITITTKNGCFLYSSSPGGTWSDARSGVSCLNYSKAPVKTIIKLEIGSWNECRLCLYFQVMLSLF